MKNRIAIASLALATILATTSIYAGPGRRPGMMGTPGAQSGPGMNGMHGGPGGFGFLGHLGRLQDELDLSDAQVTQIQTIMQAAHDQNATYRDQLGTGFHEVAAILLANPNDVAAAQAVMDRQAALERTMKTNMLNATSQALSVLTPEQRKELTTILAERAARRANRGR